MKIQAIIIAVTLTALPLLLSGCTHRSQPPSVADILETYSYDLTGAFEKALDAVNDTHSQRPDESSATAIGLLGLLYHLSGLDNESYRQLSSLMPGEVSMLDTRLRGNYYLLMAYYSAKLDRDSLRATAYCDSMIAFRMERYPGNRALHYLDLENKAAVLIQLGAMQQASDLMDSIDNLPPLEGEMYLYQHNVNRANIFLRKNDIDSAAHYARLICQRERNEVLDVQNKILAFRILQTYDSLRRDFDSYVLHRNEYEHLRFDVQDQKLRQRIAVLQANNKAETTRREADDRRNSYIIGMIMILLLSGCILGFAMWKRRESEAKRRIVQLENERLDALTFRRQLECELLNLKINEINGRLAKVQNESEHMGRLLASTVASGSPANSLEELHRLLVSRHAGFMARASARFPDLNDNELFMLGCMKMQVAPEALSKAMAISPSSLQKSRYRLRKKLGLNSADDLALLVAEI